MTSREHPFARVLKMFDSILPVLEKDRVGYRTRSDSDHVSLFLAYADELAELSGALERAVLLAPDEGGKTPFVVLKASERGLLASLRGDEGPSEASSEEECWVLVKAKHLEQVADEVITSDPDELDQMRSRESAFCGRHIGDTYGRGSRKRSVPSVEDAKRESRLEEDDD